MSHQEQECFFRVIHLNPKKADIFTVLHEVGHTLIGPMCCKGHEENAVHGFVKVLHERLGLKTPMGDRGRRYRDKFILERLACDCGIRCDLSRL